jgi:methyl-accepting chemotaxis protein
MAFLVLGALAYRITKSITEPLNEIVNVLSNLAGGNWDLTARLKVTRQDEVGKLCGAFNLFAEKLHDSMSRVASTTLTIAAAAEELSMNVVQLAKGGQQQSEQATQASVAVEEMSATVTGMAKNAQSVSGDAQEVNQAAVQGNEVVAGSISGIMRLAETVQTSASRIHSLGKRSDQIGEIVKVIQEIADQTNLLALNAAIEAARAGDQGRGFAVVADEVRKLAERTTKATKEIADTIHTIQEDTVSAVESMEAGNREAQEGMALVNSAGESLQNIVGAVQSLTGMVQQIAAAISEQSTVAESIAGNIEAVASISKQSEQGMTEMTQSSRDLARLATDLQNVVGEFKLSRA